MTTITNGMRPIHPGEVLREEFLLPLGLTAHALAMALHVPAPRINDVVRERRATFAATAAQERRRPGARTEYGNLVLAGDWTATGLPATSTPPPG